MVPGSNMIFNSRSTHPLKYLFGLLLIISFALLNGCSTTRGHRDGPPDFNVDVSNIPNAKPQYEPRAKYGNMTRYRVAGNYYYVMKDARNYEERGIASWYGTKFHKQRTSSGERYNMLGMTAAHKTLPLPTYVEVTNLKNGKQIIVKVNDRGPFAPNRIIDLSYVAAKKLEMLGHGTTYVNVKAIDAREALSHQNLWAQNKSKPQTFAANKAASNGMYLQVGAFRSKLYADKLRRRLAPILSSPVEVTHLAQTSSRLYRVKIGPIDDVATADHIKKKLRAIGLTPKHLKV